uniref:Uncharacterized protein n=1 Tax=Panagrolaimus sp. ES5 TaxID=591445 RepID=A0AC34FG42_9BILA
MKIILFLLFIFPFYTNGLNCGYSGRCYGWGKDADPIPLETKVCANECVSFKCFSGDVFHILEGSGCFEDFINACKFVPTDVIIEIKESISNYNISSDTLVFKSCNDSDGCATNGFNPWKMIDNDKNSTFGSHGTKVPDIQCYYNNMSKSSLPKVKCRSFGSCDSGEEFHEVPSDFADAGEKVCDACLQFYCSENGTQVINANGCYEDFLHACPYVSADVKEKLKANIKDSFFYGTNFIVSSCSFKDKCESGYLNAYENVYHNFSNGIDSNATETCHYDILPISDFSTSTTTITVSPSLTSSTTDPEENPNPSGSVINKFGKLAILGLIFNYLFI